MKENKNNQKNNGLAYDLNLKGKSKLTKQSTMIRKNIKHMNADEIKYLKNILSSTGYLKITKHAEEKHLVKPVEIRNIISNKEYKIIDYNYDLNNKEERILFRSKKVYKVKNNKGEYEDCFCKIVISLTTNTIITQWMNRCIDEKNKQDNIKNRYCEYFDIINKKLKI